MSSQGEYDRPGESTEEGAEIDAARRRADRPGSDGEHVLQAELGTADRADSFYDGAMQPSLNERMQTFLGDRWLGALAFLEDGWPRVRPCVGDPGTFRIEDPETVALPAGSVLGEEPTVEDPVERRWLSLVTLDWWDTTVGLHVNGTGTRRDRLAGDDGSGAAGTADDGGARGGETDDDREWLSLSVHEAYIHCAKHIPELEVRERPAERPATTRSVAGHDRLTASVERFVGAQLLAFLGTADADGETDVSPRVGPAGFVQVVDDATLAWPEYRGNGVHASLGNMYERPRASLLFPDWWSGDAVVEVTGSTVLRDRVEGAEDLTDVERTKTWVVLDVESVTVEATRSLPRLAVEEFDPPWGTDDVDAKKAGFFTG